MKPIQMMFVFRFKIMLRVGVSGGTATGGNTPGRGAAGLVRHRDVLCGGATTALWEKSQPTTKPHPMMCVTPGWGLAKS